MRNEISSMTTLYSERVGYLVLQIGFTILVTILMLFAILSNSKIVAADPTAPTNLNGVYVGTVAITSPVQLGVLDIAFTIEDDGNTLNGRVEVTRTLVFSGSPTLAGQMTGAINGITPTLRLTSETFDGTMAGTVVQRQFSLDAQVLDDGDILQGVYSETIEGLLPDPFTVEGLFIVSRPSGSVPDTPTVPTAVDNIVAYNSRLTMIAPFLVAVLTLTSLITYRLHKRSIARS